MIYLLARPMNMHMPISVLHIIIIYLTGKEKKQEGMLYLSEKESIYLSSITIIRY